MNFKTSWTIRLRSQILGPLAWGINTTFLENRLTRKIARLKRAEPHHVFGETHSHSTYSDGSAPVAEILDRAESMGLDFMVITDHLMTGLYPFECVLQCLQDAWRWKTGGKRPRALTVYPAFEISAEEGHLILILDERYLDPAHAGDLAGRFSVLDERILKMAEAVALARPLGGVAILPHPCCTRSYPFGVSLPFIENHLMGVVDGIEDISTGHGIDAAHSGRLGLASIGSSDDHLNLLAGTALTAYDRRHHDSLPAAIRARATRSIKVDRSLDAPLAIGRRFFR